MKSNKDCLVKEFSSLHAHSHFSIMDGISFPEEMVLKAKEKGLTSIAITDHGVMHGLADFYFAGKRNNVKTLYGVEGYVIDDLVKWQKLKDKKELEKKNKTEIFDDDATNTVSTIKKRNELYRKSHLVLLAQNQDGLSNLYKLTYDAHSKGFYQKPRMDKKMLSEQAKGVIATSACIGGVIANKCWQWKDGECDWKDVVKEAEEFHEIFNGNFFLELQFNELDQQRFINECLIKVHNETGILLTIAQDSHYTNQNDWETQELLYMLRSRKTILTRGDWSFDVKQLYIKSADEMWSSYKEFGGEANEKNILDAFKNTMYANSLIDNFEPDTHLRLPSLPIENPFKKLGNDSIDELKKRGLSKNEVYRKQLLYELQVIKDKGIANYFIVMKEIIDKAKEKMLVGPGRGCFLPNTHVKMANNSFLAIEKIKVGEKVIDAFSQKKEVINVMSYNIDEEIIELEFENGKIIYCTSEHKFLTKNRSWIKAFELTEDDDIIEVIT